MNTPPSGSILGANIPPNSVPLTDKNGVITPVWFNFLIQIFRRTGDTSGGDGQLTIADVIGLEADIPPPIDVAAQIAALSIALQQAFAAIAAIQQAIPAYGEVFASAGIPAVLLEQTAAAPAPVSSVTEMTFASV